MDLAGTLRIPGTVPGDSIEASGNLSFDLIHARILDGQIGINTPFTWNIPSDEPVLSFTINQAMLNSEGLLINGANSLNLAEGASVGVSFNDLVIDIMNFNIVSGSATFSSQFALKFATGVGGLNWSAVELNAPVVEQTAVRMTLPENLSLGTDGLAMSGQTNILVRFEGEEYPDVGCVFSEAFNIDYSPFGVSRGRADFFVDESMVAFVDSNGFHPGDFFGILPLPAKLPIPDTTVAYIVLKDGDNVLVQSESVAEGLRISTDDNQTVQLVIPALQYDAPQPPSFGVSFSVVVNISTFELVDGSVSVTPAEGAESLFSLASAGIPLDLTQLLFSRVNNLPTFMASAKITLPEALGGVNVSLDSLVISAQGFSGQVTLGQFTEFYQPEADYIANVPIGDMFNFKVGGVQANFSMDDFSFRFCGDLQTQLFSQDADTAAIHYVAAYQSGEFGFSFDISHMPDAVLPLYIASFRPEAIGDNPPFDLSFPQGGFSLTLSGTLILDDFGEGFAVSFGGLTISQDGVTVPEINITTPEDFLRFTLFSADFEIKDVESYPGLAFDYQSNIFYLMLSGELTFLDNTSSFYGLKIGTNGSVSIEGVSLISQELYIVDDYLALTHLGIESNALQVEGFAKLPEPCDTSRQLFNFSITANGEVDGGANIVIFNETPGLGGNDDTELPLWVATFDPTYAALNFDFGDIQESSLQLIADMYFMSDADRWVRLGNKTGGVISPGFEVKFNGSVRWGNLESSAQLFNVDWEAVRFDSLRFASFDAEQAAFGLSISGKLNVNVSGVGGGLQFTGLRITSSGQVENLAQSITGGDITITDIVTISISNIGFSSSPTDIEVAAGAACNDIGGEVPEGQANMVHVTSYFQFGATIDISGVGGGGIREFLAYTTENSTHLIIDSAYVNIPEVVVFTIDLTYEQVDGEGFSLLMGGQGLFANTYSIIVVGKIAHLGGETSFGLFVAVDVTITIPPCLVITGLGGGFFYNPTECDLALVRSMAGFGDDNPAGEEMNADPGRFAILLYGQLAVVNDYLVYGRVLLTITENYFRLDGRVVLLDQDTYLKGSIYLMVGFSNGFAEGNIEVEVTVGDFIDGRAGLSFFVYGADAWGIRGFVDMEIMKLLDAEATLFIGNPGFLVQMSMTYGFSMWIIEINAGFETMAWYKVNVSWGLYAKVWVEAEAFWGLLTAKGWLEAALIKKQDWYVFGLAGIKGCVLGMCKSASVWVKIHDGDIDGGTGRNSEMDDMIEEAKNTGQEMEDEAEEAQDAINDALVDAFLLSDEQLISAFSNLYQYSQLLRQDELFIQIIGALFLVYVGDLQEMEFTRGQAPLSPDGYYCNPRGYSWDYCFTMWGLHRQANLIEAGLLPVIYNNYFLNLGAPDPEGRDSLRTVRDQIDQLIDQLDTDRNQLAARLNQVSSDLSSIPGLEFAFENPVSTANFDFAAEEYQQGDTTYKQATIMPGFSLDEILALGNEETMEQAEEEYGAYEQAIVDRVNQLESALQSINDALESSGNDINMDDYGRSYGELIYEVGRFFVGHVSYTDDEKEYARASASSLQSHEGQLQSMFQLKSQGMLASELQDLAWERKKTILKFNLTENIETVHHTEFLNMWNGLDNQPNALALKRQICTQLGMQLWYDLCLLGFGHLDSVTTDLMQTTVPTQYEDQLANLALSQTAYTESLDPLFEARVALTEKLYDIISLYGQWQQQAADTIEWLIPTGQVASKKSNLMQQLQVPDINSVNVNTTNLGFWNYGSMNWSASHPAGIIDYSINITRQGQPMEGVGLQSVGKRTYLTRYFLQRDNVITENWTLNLRARGGAGYANLRQTNFMTYFSPDAPGGVGGYHQHTMETDATPPTQPSIGFPSYSMKLVSMYIPGLGYITIPYYYSSNVSEIHADWSSSDDESGVVEYQYSVGTSAGATNIKGWTSVGGMDEQTIYGVTLQTGQLYYVNVKSKNGENLWSPVGSSSRLLIDTTPPTTPNQRFVYEIPPMGGPFGGPVMPMPSVIPPIPLPAELVPPILPGMPYVIPSYPGAEPSVTTYWHAAVDNESGVYGYQYRLISATDTTNRSEDWVFVENDLGVTIEDDLLTYSDSFFVDIQAVNNVGLTSGSLRNGPYQPVDPSDPSQPQAALSYGLPGGTNYLLFSNRSLDFETGVDHYEIGIGSLPNSTNILGWGNDFEPSDIGVANSWVIPDLGLAQGTTCYIHLKAVNGSGMNSNQCITGPYLIDNTAPITPVVTPQLLNRGRLQLNYANIADPESGVDYIEYGVGTVFHGVNLTGWVDVGVTSNTLLSRMILGMTSGNTYFIGVRTTNGVNLKSQEFWTIIYIP